MFADNFVEELKDRIDLYDLISPYVQLKKSGSKWVGLSPFNQEKTPSFYVDSDRGFFHCFSSGEKGDALSFVQKVENLTFPEAIEFLANRFGIPIRYAENSGGKANTYRKSIKSDLYAVQETAMSWFAEQFHSDTEDSRIALDYWIKERKFTLDDAKKFGIGYAPVDRFALAHYLQKKGISEVILSKSGLFNEKKQSGQFASRFCGRLMIPIREKIGRVCGFTARQLAMTPSWGDRKSPKYVNSPETPIFQKVTCSSTCIWPIRKLMKPGNSFWWKGSLMPSVAGWKDLKPWSRPRGLLLRIRRPCFCASPTPRGWSACLMETKPGKKRRLIHIPTFLRVGLDARFTTLPEGKDPDQILIEEGTEGLQNILDKGMTAIEYAVHFQTEWKSESPGLRKFVRSVSWFFRPSRKWTP
jgi:DNA primase